jgi:hypothetical protein
MTMLDIGAVTRTLIKVVDISVNTSPAWPPLPSPQLAVSPMPPDKLTGDPMAGLYMYHIAEDAAFKNSAPPPGASGVRFTPMGLNLFYVLTARSGDSDAGTLTEQLIMGLAMKALRDIPIIDDGTMLGGGQVLDPGIRNADNRVRISLQPVPAAEAVSYWTAGSAPLRLAAYYQVSVALLEPDEATAYAPRVLRYGAQVFTGGPPLLDASQSIVTYRLPGETTDRTAVAQPAQVTQLPPGDPFTLLGSGIVGGKPVLLIRPGAAPTPLVADAAWQVQPTSLGVVARAQPTASGTPVPPGLYGVSVRIDRTITLPDGSPRVIAQTSNEVPLTIAPGVSGLSAPDAAGNFTITGTGFTPAAALILVMGEDKAVPGAPLLLNPGEFDVPSATTIAARLPAGLASGSIVPVRVMVSGAEAPPQWVIAP